MGKLKHFTDIAENGKGNNFQRNYLTYTSTTPTLNKQGITTVSPLQTISKIMLKLTEVPFHNSDLCFCAYIFINSNNRSMLSYRKDFDFIKVKHFGHCLHEDCRHLNLKHYSFRRYL